MRELSLFSGAGGGLLATHHLLGWQAVGYVERDQYCQSVIAARIRDGWLSPAPIYGDVRGFCESGAAAEYRGFADVVTAGFPCQPFSVAGVQRGAGDSRNQWPATVEVLRRVRPEYAFLENVPQLVNSGYFGTILGDLAELGFDARWCVLGADDVGAPHIRKRLWVRAAQGGVSDPERQRLREQRQRKRKQRREQGATEPAIMGDGVVRLLSGNERGVRPDYWGWSGVPGMHDWGRWERYLEEGHPEPAIRGTTDGLADRVERHRAIGNGQVPAVAALAWEILNGDT